MKSISIRIGSRFAYAAAILTALTFSAEAQVPTVITSQLATLASYPSGAPGGSVAVNSLGNMLSSTTYGGQIVQFNGTTGAATVLGSFNYPGPVAVDASNNLYIGDVYDSVITKIPFVSGSYAAVSAVSASTPACTGSDTTECVVPMMTTASFTGYAALAFDTNGNFYFATANSGTAGNTIFECTAACLAAGTATAIQVFQETQPASGSPLVITGIALDSLSDVFFTDAITSNATTNSSNIKELAAASGAATLHATAPQVLYTNTDASPYQYDDSITAVAVDVSDTVYFATAYEGIFAFVNNAGTVNTAYYTVAGTGPAVLTSDRKSSLYGAGFSNSTGGDVAYKFSINLVNLPTTAVGATNSVTNVLTIVSDSTYCGNGNTTTVTSLTTEFAATVGNCSGNNLTAASMYATTVAFTPAAPGTRTATLTATNGTNTGTATAIGTATGGTVATPTFNPVGGAYTGAQSVTISDATVGATIYYTLDGTTPTTASNVYTAPITVSASETINALAVYAGSTNSAVGTATYTITAVTAPTPTFSPGTGSYTTVQSVTISDTLAGATIYYTTDGTTPTTSSTQYAGAITVSASETIEAIAVATGYANSAVATATYTLNLESTWVLNHDGSVTRLNSAGTVLATAAPTTTSASTLGGVAVDSTGDVWAVANQSSSLTEVSPAGVLVGGYMGAGITNPVGVAIDGLGRVWVANSNNSVSVFSNGGAALSPATGYTGGAMSTPSGIAIDETGGVWIANAANSTVTHIIGSAAPAVAPTVSGVTTGTTGTRP